MYPRIFFSYIFSRRYVALPRANSWGDLERQETGAPSQGQPSPWGGDSIPELCCIVPVRATDLRLYIYICCNLVLPSNHNLCRSSPIDVYNYLSTDLWQKDSIWSSHNICIDLFIDSVKLCFSLSVSLRFSPLFLYMLLCQQCISVDEGPWVKYSM